MTRLMKTGPRDARVELRVHTQKKQRWLEAAAREERSLSSWLELAGDARAAAPEPLTKRKKRK